MLVIAGLDVFGARVHARVEEGRFSAGEVGDGEAGDGVFVAAEVELAGGFEVCGDRGVEDGLMVLVWVVAGGWVGGREGSWRGAGGEG